jgi:hypothetical protein
VVAASLARHAARAYFLHAVAIEPRLAETFVGESPGIIATEGIEAAWRATDLDDQLSAGHGAIGDLIGLRCSGLAIAPWLGEIPLAGPDHRTDALRVAVRTREPVADPGRPRAGREVP